MADFVKSPPHGSSDASKDPSPSQCRGACGHLMAIFDAHQRCARCREGGKGQDLCVQGKECHICAHLTPSQKQQLATPRYRERKDWLKRRPKILRLWLTLLMSPFLAPLLRTPLPLPRRRTRARESVPKNPLLT